MAVQKRRHLLSHPDLSNTNDGGDHSKIRSRDSQCSVIRMACAACALIIATAYVGSSTWTRGSSSYSMAIKPAMRDANYVVHRRRLSPEADMQLYLTKAHKESETVLLGPHRVQVTVAASCSYPRFFMRAQGEALVHIMLTQTPDQVWNGGFHLPVNGSYAIDVRWYDCQPRTTPQSFAELSEPITFHAEGDGAVPTAPRNPYYYAGKLLAANSAWISTKRMRLQEAALPSYMWMNVGAQSADGDFVKTAQSLVHQRGTVGPNGFYKFGEVGNYELVCFMGSETMQKIRQAFLDMRGYLFSHQRPFKFHMYTIHSFVKPDEHWEVDTKRRLRKCKHILLALEDFREPLSQEEYSEQITRFVNYHLQNVIPDKTFPIWVFSISEPPMNTTTCYNPKLPRTTDHPCNDALRHLFRPGSHSFDDRIHFLDNTDLSLPQFDANSADVLANIALRVYVIVGKGVSIWRHMGQCGMEDGLHRNGTVEPNFELIPYAGWD